MTAHEFFHAWNVKRIRPRPLGPFDYSQQVHTPSLWISEGLTSYYGSLAVVRAGLITPQEYLDSIAKLITKFEQEPGRKERSIEDTSWDTWFVRDTKLDNNLTEHRIIPTTTAGRSSAIFSISPSARIRTTRKRWMTGCACCTQRYALPKPGFEPEDAIKALSEVGGMDFTDFFHRYISGKEPLPYETYFAYAGIAVEKKMDETKPWTGMDTSKAMTGAPRFQTYFPAARRKPRALRRTTSSWPSMAARSAPDELSR